MTTKRKPVRRGSKSMMNLSAGGSAQWSRSPSHGLSAGGSAQWSRSPSHSLSAGGSAQWSRSPSHGLSAGGSAQWSRSPSHGRNPCYSGSPNQRPYYPGPPNQGPSYPDPYYQGSYYPGPPNQHHYYSHPPNQGHYNQGPSSQDHYTERAKGKSFTVKATDFYGDVEIPEICIYAVNNKCKNEEKGCKYLHAKSLFHWQVGKENKLYNFRIFQSKTLESAYRDVSKGGVKLPPIDVEKLSTPDKQILDMLGTHDWTADFKDMCITSPANKKLNIRRVSTPSSAISSIPQATVYKWHFADEQGKWICYGHVDSQGKQDYVCNITSEDIEKQYVRDSSSSMIVSNAHFKYKLDLKNMTQTNLTSMKVREIRRRPACLSYQRSSSNTTTTTTTTTTATTTTTTTATTTTSDAFLPAHWQPMSDNEAYILVTVASDQAEYQNISKRIKLTVLTARVHEIRRLQNKYLWLLLQHKKANLSQRYDDITMNVQKLFHGTNPDSIDSICKENIDGQRYTNTKEKYGKGTYFSNSCAVARTYCTPSSQARYFLVMAEVIIGYVTVGSKGLKQPPQNTSTGCRYDTTVDSLTAPTVFVKYCKEEYYPQYIVEISV